MDCITYNFRTRHYKNHITIWSLSLHVSSFILYCENNEFSRIVELNELFCCLLGLPVSIAYILQSSIRHETNMVTADTDTVAAADPLTLAGDGTAPRVAKFHSGPG